jgi:ribosome-associated translation inhibitor RaiA
MIQVIFHNLEKSELARAAVIERLQETVDRFPELSDHRMTITLRMYNSPVQAGPDLFGVKLHISGVKFDNIIVEKKAASLYVAIGDLCESLLERLNRRTDKVRVKTRTQAREFRKKALVGA